MRDARPAVFSPGVWRLMRALDVLPARVAGRLVGSAFVVRNLADSDRRHRAFAWASAHRTSRGGRARLAVELLFRWGQSVAEAAMVGVRSPADFLQGFAVENLAGAEAPGPGALLVGFHIGPPGSWLALRAHGHAVTFAGARLENGRLREVASALGVVDALTVRGQPGEGSPGALYEMRRRLLAGETIWVAGDGFTGRLALRLEVPGGIVQVRGGWLALRRMTKAPAFPVLAHRQGRRRVAVIHPALPDVDSAVEQDTAACGAALARILTEYARRRPADCYSAALWPR